MKERRKFSRVPTKLKAHYCLKEEEGWKECTIIDVSQKGMGIKFLTREIIIVSSTIHLKIFIPKESSPINAKGTLKWIKPRENDFIGGIEVTVLTEEGL